jgi:hypothetical protein
MKASARTWEGEILHIHGTGVEISKPSADGWDALVRIRRVNADVLIAGSSLTVTLKQRGAPFIRRVGYESLTGVGYSPRTGWRSRETLRLGVVVEDRRQLCIDLMLQKTVDAAEVAQSIAQRAARHRLRHAPAGHREHYAGLAAAGRLPLPRFQRFAVYQLEATTQAAPAVSAPGWHERGRPTASRPRTHASG